MSTTEQETKKEEVKVARGLMIRTFEGKIQEDKDKKLPEITYSYDRIVMPWNRAGKDKEGKSVEGSVPSLSEVMAWAQKTGFTTEIKLDKDNNPEGPSVCELLCNGINQYLNSLARTKAQNTPESAKEKSIQLFMSKTGMSRSDAIKTLQAMFAGEK